MADVNENLTRDAIAAQKAGLHYGDYMAQKGNIQAAAARPELDIEPPRYCPTCGVEIFGQHGRQIYCSRSCKNKANYQQKKLKGGEHR